MSQGDKDKEDSKNLPEAAVSKDGGNLKEDVQELAGDSQDLAENASDQTEANQQANQKTSQKTKTKTKSKAGFFLFVFILILLAFGGGGYGAYYYLNTQMLEREAVLETSLSAELSDGIKQLEQRFSSLQEVNQDLNRKQSDIQRAVTAVASDTESQMSALAERLAANESEGPADWTLAEVEYLLRIANQRLITSRDQQTAIEMLQAADTILKELAYPELAPVRRQLALDITELQLVNQVDVEGVYFSLEAVSAEVSKLQQFAPEYVVQPESKLNEDSSTWDVLWSKVTAILLKYVRIDTEAGEPQYLVTDEQEVARRLSIQLQLRQAQLALLSGQQDIFSAALSGASSAIRQYYAAAGLAKRLDALSVRKVEHESMNVNDSIRILSKVIDQLTRREQ